MLTVGALGLLVNVVSLLLLRGGAGDEEGLAGKGLRGELELRGRGATKRRRRGVSVSAML